MFLWNIHLLPLRRATGCRWQLPREKQKQIFITAKCCYHSLLCCDTPGCLSIYWLTKILWQNYGPFTPKWKNNHSSIQVASDLFSWLVNTTNYSVVLKSWNCKFTLLCLRHHNRGLRKLKQKWKASFCFINHMQNHQSLQKSFWLFR